MENSRRQELINVVVARWLVDDLVDWRRFKAAVIARQEAWLRRGVGAGQQRWWAAANEIVDRRTQGAQARVVEFHRQWV